MEGESFHRSPARFGVGDIEREGLIRIDDRSRSAKTIGLSPRMRTNCGLTHAVGRPLNWVSIRFTSKPTPFEYLSLCTLCRMNGPCCLLGTCRGEAISNCRGQTPAGEAYLRRTQLEHT